MSGHSKWHNIKIRKAKQDQKKGQLFGKAIREITVAAREGGPNPDGNQRLRLALQKAREVGVPNDSIERAVKRGSGETGGAHLEEAMYEGYGPHGVALLVHVMTDNRNRTGPAIRRILAKGRGSLGEAGCVRWVFERRGLIAVPASAIGEDDLMLLAIEGGAEDVKQEGDMYEIYCAPEALEALRQKLAEAQVAYSSAEVTYLPQTTVALDGDKAASVLRLLEALEEYEDVQAVYANFDIPESVMQKVAA